MTERLLALLVVAASGAYLLSAWPLPHGTMARPGAGFFPLGVGAFGAIMALVWTVSAFRRRAAAGRVERRRGARRGRCGALGGAAPPGRAHRLAAGRYPVSVPR